MEKGKENMIPIEIPGAGSLTIENLILDFNGTVATDGKIPAGVARRLERLSRSLRLFVVSADTYGNVSKTFRGTKVEVVRTLTSQSSREKVAFLRRLGGKKTAAIGNGYNDRLLLKEAALGIAVIGKEGAAPQALRSCDVVVHEVADALDLLLRPLRTKATLRG